MEKNNLSKQIRQLADISGIDALGFAAAGEFKGYRITTSRRRSPKLSLPDAKTVIVAGIYGILHQIPKVVYTFGILHMTSKVLYSLLGKAPAKGE